MKQLTEKEEELMKILWEKEGEVIAREVWEAYPEPRPHFNTVATFLRILENKGWVSHRPIGNTNLYKAIYSKEEFGRKSLASIISKFFNGSLTGMVSSLIKDEDVTPEDIKEIRKIIEEKKKSL